MKTQAKNSTYTQLFTHEKVMKNLIRKYRLNFGYSPTLYELHSVYTSGSLILSDKEKYAILYYIELTT